MKFPVLCELPHGGDKTPPEVLPYSIIEEEWLTRDSDEYSDQLYLDHPVQSILRNKYWRAYFDANRLLDDFSDDGAVKRITSQGKQIYRDKDGLPKNVVDQIIQKYGKPYHNELHRLTDDKNIRGILLCHTMPTIGRGARGDDEGEIRPLFMLGNDGDTQGNPGETNFISRKKMEYIAGQIIRKSEALNLKDVRYQDTVRFNDPYQGNMAKRIGQKHINGRPVLILEVTRDLPRCHAENIPVIRRMIRSIVEALLETEQILILQ